MQHTLMRAVRGPDSGCRQVLQWVLHLLLQCTDLVLHLMQAISQPDNILWLQQFQVQDEHPCTIFRSRHSTALNERPQSLQQTAYVPMQDVVTTMSLASIFAIWLEAYTSYSSCSKGRKGCCLYACSLLILLAASKAKNRIQIRN